MGSGTRLTSTRFVGVALCSAVLVWVSSVAAVFGPLAAASASAPAGRKPRAVASKRGDWRITVPGDWSQATMPSDSGGFSFTGRNRTAALVVYSSKRWANPQKFIDAQTKLVRTKGLVTLTSATIGTVAGHPAAIMVEKVKFNNAEVVEIAIVPEGGTAAGPEYGVRVTTTLVPDHFDTKTSRTQLEQALATLVVA